MSVIQFGGNTINTLNLEGQIIVAIVTGLMALLPLIIMVKWVLPMLVRMIGKVGHEEFINRCSCSRCKKQKSYPLWKWQIKRHFQDNDIEK